MRPSLIILLGDMMQARSMVASSSRMLPGHGCRSTVEGGEVSTVRRGCDSRDKQTVNHDTARDQRRINGGDIGLEMRLHKLLRLHGLLAGELKLPVARSFRACRYLVEDLGTLGPVPRAVIGQWRRESNSDRPAHGLSGTTLHESAARQPAGAGRTSA